MKSFFRVIKYLALAYFLLATLFNLLHLFTESENQQVEYEVLDSVNQVVTHHRCWVPPGQTREQCERYLTYSRVSDSVTVLRNGISPTSYDYQKYWGHVYRSLHEQNSALVRFLSDSLSRAARDLRLSGKDLAHYIVNYVQDIPYEYILTEACTENETAKHPCVANQKFGLLAPYEFVHTSSGDCDTRAVLLYSLLSNLGFDPAVVLSKEYLHAMLAINLPGTGDYIAHEGKKYYFWETTAMGWQMGMLPPGYSNPIYWKIALINEH